MIAARSGHTATTLLDGHVLVVGGQTLEAAREAQTAPVQLASAEVFDPTSGTWTATASLAAPRFGHSATLLPDGTVLVAGGIDFEGAQAAKVEIMGRTTAELYDPVTGRWTATESMAVGRGGHSATLLRDGRVLVAGGGEAGEEEARTAELYDPIAGTWTSTGSMAVGRFDAPAALLPDGRVLVAGGRSIGSDPTPLNTAELYDPASGSWDAAGSPFATGHACGTSVLPDGRVLAVGRDDQRYPIAAMYDPAAGTWADAGAVTVDQLGCAATLLTDGRVLAVGVVDGDTPATAAIFDPRTGTWSATPPQMRTRTSSASALLDDGRVLVAGGDFHAVPTPENASVGTAELFDPRGSAP